MLISLSAIPVTVRRAKRPQEVEFSTCEGTNFFMKTYLTRSVFLLTLVLTVSGIHGQSRRENIYSKKYVTAMMAKVYDWQIANPVGTNDQSLWARATFYPGIMAAYRVTGDKKYL